MRINLPITGIRHTVPDSEVLVTRTDLKGIITYCNRAFCEVSGYSEAELLGRPHNLVRHPDVPAAMFAACWDVIQSGKPWHSILKNRCKNGDYYWVEANVTPWLEHDEIVGYVSLRYRASEEQITAAEAIYQAVREGAEVAAPLKRTELRYVVDLQQRLAEKILALEKYRDHSEEELRIGSEILQRINSTNGTQDPILRQMISAAAHYSGDMLIAARTPANVLNVLLADAVGHGLTAAINVLPLSQAFYAMTKRGFRIAQIAAELNQKIHLSMPVDRFVSAMLVAIDLREQVIEVWNGGAPPPVLIDPEGEILHKWPSRHLPLGILGERDFSARTEIFHYQQGCQLFMFSDGLSEAESPDGLPFGKERIDTLLQRSAPAVRFDELAGALEQHLDGQAAHDDVSLAMVNIVMQGDEDHPPGHLIPQSRVDLGGDWRVAISLGAQELKHVEVVPMLTQMVASINVEQDCHTMLFLILSELFNNALDHGILQLDSHIKLGADGFEEFLALREARLDALVSGSIDIEISKAIIAGQCGVKIRVLDSGMGFDHEALKPDALDQAGQYGRGIALVRSMAYKLEYSQRGKEAIVYCVCS